METFPFLHVAIGAECSIERSIPFLTRWKTKPKAKVCRMKRIEEIACTVHVVIYYNFFFNLIMLN